MNELSNPNDMLREYVMNMPDAKVTITDALGNEVYFDFASIDISMHSYFDLKYEDLTGIHYPRRDPDIECYIRCYYRGENITSGKENRNDLRRETGTSIADKSTSGRCRIESKDN